jgi:hypothetical protein
VVLIKKPSIKDSRLSILCRIDTVCRYEIILPYTNTILFKIKKMKIKIFKPRPKVYEQLVNPKPRTGLIRRQNIEVGKSTKVSHISS